MTLCPTCGRRPSERIGMDTSGMTGPTAGGWKLEKCQDSLHDLADRCAEIRREALEEACKAECGMCAMGLPIYRGAHHWSHRETTSGVGFFEGECGAGRIRDLIAKEKA